MGLKIALQNWGIIKRDDPRVKYEYAIGSLPTAGDGDDGAGWEPVKTDDGTVVQRREIRKKEVGDGN